MRDTTTSPADHSGSEEETARLSSRVIDDIYHSVGAETAQELLKAYLTELEMRIKALQESALHGDRDAFVNHAHSLKGASGTFGATGVEDAARVLERTAREGDSLAPESLEDIIHCASATQNAFQNDISRRVDTDG